MVAVGDVSEQTGAEVETVSADDLYDVDTDADMVTIGEAATAVATLTLCPEEGEEVGAQVEVFEGGLDDLLAALSEGLVVPSSEAVEGDGAFCHDVECPVTLCIEIEIPTTVGNELQGAESSFDLSVYAEQCRHNDVEQFGNTTVVAPTNPARRKPRAPTAVTTGDAGLAFGGRFCVLGGGHPGRRCPVPFGASVAAGSAVRCRRWKSRRGTHHD